MGKTLEAARQVTCVLAGAVILAPVPAGAQSAFPEKEFCHELRRVVKAVVGTDKMLRALKGKRESKNKWAARKNLSGMNGCTIVDDGPAKHVMDFFLRTRPATNAS